jgi:hypothetical protein
MIDREYEKEKARKRRNRNSKKQNKAFSICKNNYEGLSDEEIKEISKKEMNNLKACSCYLCGNVRKNHGKTIQEKRFYQQDDF